MSDYDINKMDFKQLRNEVQLLRDELAIFKRKYEDIIYNLDDDNFSGKFLKEKEGMKTSIEQTEESIKLQAEKVECNTTKIGSLEVTADAIQSEVFEENEDGTKVSKIQQIADGVETTVKNVVNDAYIKNALGDEYVTDATFETKFNVYANGIYSTVSSTYETKDNAQEKYNSLGNRITNVSVTANGISLTVGEIQEGQFGQYTLFEQTSGKFKFTGDVEISGNSIVGGTISGASLKNSTGTHRLEMDGSSGLGTYGTFRLYNNYYGDVPYFSIYDDSLGGIDLMVGGEEFLSASASTDTVTTYGTWDFSSCNVKGISGGGDGIAKFG